MSEDYSENNIDGKRGRRNPATAQSELILSKEQLYDMFQYILGIKRFEHQLMYQGCQVRIRLWYGSSEPLTGLSLH